MSNHIKTTKRICRQATPTKANVNRVFYAYTYTESSRQNKRDRVQEAFDTTHRFIPTESLGNLRVLCWILYTTYNSLATSRRTYFLRCLLTHTERSRDRLKRGRCESSVDREEYRKTLRCMYDKRS